MRPAPAVTPILKLVFLCAIGWWIWHRSIFTPHVLTKFDIEELAEQTQPEVPVHVGAIKQQAMDEYLTLFGTVEAAPGSADGPPAGASVSVANRALVTSVSCIEGQQVSKGQELFVLEGGKTVVSPLAGTVTRLQIRPGEIATPLVTAVEIVNLDRLVVAVDVPAIDLPRIRVGQGAVIDSISPIVTGLSVNRIDHQIDPVSGMGSVDVTIPAGMTLRPGQIVQVKIAVEHHAGALNVPAQSIARDSQNRPSIAVLIRQGRWAQLQPVEVGLEENGVVEIHGSNLVAGESIVTGGAYALPDAAAIRVLKD